MSISSFLNHNITIHRYVSSVSNVGSPGKTFTKLSENKASIQPVGIPELIRLGRPEDAIAFNFILLPDVDVTQRDRIEWKKDFYEIIKIKEEPDDHKKCYGERVV